nr:MAG TPA: hypothetical protein [Caudoviricetes sp.]
MDRPPSNPPPARAFICNQFQADRWLYIVYVGHIDPVREKQK